MRRRLLAAVVARACWVCALVVADRLTVPASLEQVRVVRTWLRDRMGPEHPCADSASTVASELATNAILHGSRPGARVQVNLRRWPGRRVSLSVADWGSGTGSKPTMKMVRAASESGRGLLIVGSLAARMKVRRNHSGYRVCVLLHPRDQSKADSFSVEELAGLGLLECVTDQPGGGMTDDALQRPHA
ncbi:ATP-binding protein [Actinomadura harenae]|uniref:ATP-binding protein n=2 Tax=Actinomadura harenae TaxID=2483351 RepID=A0A3M2L065_9ACTN|nr:ATP-binding protein [Actinomadura harenae]